MRRRASASATGGSDVDRKKAWKLALRKTLQAAPGLTSSQAITDYVNDFLKACGRRPVSKSMIDKWRAKEGFLPSDATLATALVASLERLGAFRDESARQAAEKNLVRTLDFEPVDLPGEVFLGALRSAQDELRDVLRVGGDLNEHDQGTCASCLVSQSLAMRTIHRRATNTGVRGISLLWYDVDATSVASAQRQAVAAEIETSLIPFLRESAWSGKRWDVVLCNARSNSERPPGAEAARQGRGFGEESESEHPAARGETVNPLDAIAGRPGIPSGPAFQGLPNLAAKLGDTGAGLWWLSLEARDAFRFLDLIAVLPKDNEDPACWRLVRHPELFRKLHSAHRSTFMSPVPPTEARENLFRLGIWCEPGMEEWVMDRAIPIPVAAANGAAAPQEARPSLRGHRSQGQT
jgi:hypothetical protein